MNIEVLAWLTFVAGLMVFGVVKALSWQPLSIRVLLWFLGASLMGLAMIYFVNVYDPKMTRQAADICILQMKITRFMVIVLSVYVICKWGGDVAKLENC